MANISLGADDARVIDWLLEDPDPSLACQVRRDLMGEPESALLRPRSRIGNTGWASDLMGRRRPDGHWGNGIYNPKWTCTHYALYELVQLEMPRDNAACRESASLLLSYPTGRDGGVNYAKTVEYSDVCINGMIISICSWFRLDGDSLQPLVDYLLDMKMADGGWNCAYPSGPHHSSLHTTIAVIEGLAAFIESGVTYRQPAIRDAIAGGIEFILEHRLFRSDHTGEVIRDEFFKFPFPVRWKYDILRCLDLFRRIGVPYDERMRDALDRIEASRRPNGRWKAASQPGATYFVQEKNGSDGRWNTLRALRTLGRYRFGRIER
ncbi:MAG: hypothetical protein E4H20_10980 [Spirochaetales bacterium]|nr:MAG: hypothetical protein E4H20_10980 [Spirochaetales bacterium]